MLAALVVIFLGLYLWFEVENLLYPMNDICTDPDKPLQFIKPPTESEYNSDNAPVQKKRYPYIKPLRFSGSAAEGLTLIESEIKKRKDWEILRKDDPTHRIQAIAYSEWLSFKDDLMFQIEIVDKQRDICLIHVRSRTRDAFFGTCDFGTNARRISNFLNSIKQHIEANKKKL